MNDFVHLYVRKHEKKNKYAFTLNLNTIGLFLSNADFIYDFTLGIDTLYMSGPSPTFKDQIIKKIRTLTFLVSREDFKKYIKKC